MVIRTTALTLIGMGLLGFASAPAAQASDWRFVRVYRALNACQSAGQGLVAQHRAHEYRCENDYDRAGVPVLDLYTR